MPFHLLDVKLSGIQSAHIEQQVLGGLELWQCVGLSGLLASICFLRFETRSGPVWFSLLPSGEIDVPRRLHVRCCCMSLGSFCVPERCLGDSSRTVPAGGLSDLSWRLAQVLAASETNVRKNMLENREGLRNVHKIILYIIDYNNNSISYT